MTSDATLCCVRGQYQPVKFRKSARGSDVDKIQKILDFKVLSALKIYLLKELSVRGGGIDEKREGKGISSCLSIFPL